MQLVLDADVNLILSNPFIFCYFSIILYIDFYLLTQINASAFKI